MDAECLFNIDFYQKCLSLTKIIFSNSKFTGMRVSRNEYGSYGFFVSRLNKEIETYSEYNEFVSCLENDEVLSLHINDIVGTKTGGTRIEPINYVNYFIRYHLDYNQGIFSFNKEVFDNSYSNLEQFFYGSTFKKRAILKLIGFRSTKNEIRFSDDLCIRLIDERDFSVFSRRDFREISAEYVIEYEYIEEKLIGVTESAKNTFEYLEQINKTINDKIESVVFALRLYKKGGFRLGQFYNLSFPRIGQGFNFSEPDYNPYRHRFSKYELLAEEAENIVSFYHGYDLGSLIKKNNEFTISLRRFNDGLNRLRDDDKIIDLIIGFEALLYKQGENSELLYRLRLRTSKLLEKKFDKRLLLKRRINKMYELRSAIVHGEKYEIKKEIIEECEDMLRDSLKKYMDCRRGMSHEEIIDKLDFSEIDY